MPALSASSELPAGHSTPPLAAPEALSVGTRLGEFRILRVLGAGGFGIVYLAHDDSLHRQVALKEYLPAIWAGRGTDLQVKVRSGSFDAIFAAGLSSFVNEARLLARFDHPSLVEVHRFWEANGTAYMVMPYYEGVSLKQVRESMSVAPDEAWLRRLLDGLLGALEVMHGACVFHRDVAPDNILLLPSGKPMLLDFGAARHVLAGQTQVLTSILKPSYAPIEQYAGVPEVRQGPWTDIYATAATLHYCLTGNAPPTAAARALHDTHRPLHQREEFSASASIASFDKQWLEALDWGLSVMPQARPQSIAQWCEALAGRLTVPAAISSARPAGAASMSTAAGGVFPATELHARMRFPATEPEAAWVRGSAPQAMTASMPAGALGLRIKPVHWLAPGLAAVALVGGLWPMQASSPTPSAAEALVFAAPAALASISGADDAALPSSGPAVVVASSDAHGAAQRPAQPASTPNGVAREPAPVGVQQVRTATAVPRTEGPRKSKGDRLPASKSASAPVTVLASASASPRQLCDQPAWLSRLNCMRITCAVPKWEPHPHCASWQVLTQRWSS